MFRLFILLSVVSLLVGCASPATDVAVGTMSMEQAWQRGDGREVGVATAKLVVSPGAANTPIPIPVVSPPDVRMAYLYPWTDYDGNLHYGTWVAIPVEIFRWVLPDGTTVPMNGNSYSVSPATGGVP